MSTFHARSCRGYREKRWTDGRRKDTRTHTHTHTRTDRPTAITLRCACAQARVNYSCATAVEFFLCYLAIGLLRTASLLISVFAVYRYCRVSGTFLAETDEKKWALPEVLVVGGKLHPAKGLAPRDYQNTS